MIHEQLQKARVDRGMSRGELAKLSGVPRERIRQIETGANFTLETLQKLLPHLPNLKTIYLGSAELRVGGETEIAALRDELSSWLESGRRIMTMLEKIQVVPAAATPGPREMTPELEERLQQLEREIAEVKGTDPRKS